jgi:hypothetical protein
MGYDIEPFINKAANYDLLAQYYKYTNPELHIKYYKKHLKYLQMATEMKEKAPIPNPFTHTRFLNLLTKDISIHLNSLEIFKKLPSEGLTEYFILPSNVYQLEISPENPINNPVALNRNLEIRGENYSTYMITNKDIHYFTSEQFIPEYEAKLRVIHLSENTSQLDVRVKGGDCVFPNVSYGNATSYLGLSPISVQLEITTHKTKDVLLTLPKIFLQPNTIYSLLIVANHEENNGLKTLLIKD